MDNDRQPRLLTEEEDRVLEMFREAKELRFADIAASYQDGTLTKLWLTIKSDVPYHIKTLHTHAARRG